MVDMADDMKSNIGPRLCIVSTCFDRETILFICRRTSSSTAKLTAPCGIDNISCAPAPRVNVRAYFHCVKDSTFNGFWPGILRDDWRIVFIVFAGCIIVCAALRLTAPQIIASQNCNRRPVVAAMATEDPPLISVRVCSSCISNSKSASLVLVAVVDEIHPPVLRIGVIPGNNAWRRDDDNLGRFVEKL
jgi:hypothetical protein